MGKRIIIDESVLRGILMEITKERFTINEIKSIDAYNKFYKNKIDAEVFETLMDGQKTMTPFHKAALDTLVANQESGEYQPLAFAEVVSTAWKTARPEMRQALLAIGGGNKTKTMTMGEFINSLKTASGKRWYSEGEMSSGGLVVLYEDEVIRVTCTTTYAASTKNFSHTHWCTASDLGGNYNGWAMFLDYTGLSAKKGDKSCLVQITSKQNKENCYQIQYNHKGADEIRDFNDDYCGMEGLCYAIRDMYVSANKNQQFVIQDLMTPQKINELIALTEENEREEYDYWFAKTAKKYNQLRDYYNSAVWNEENIAEILNRISYAMNYEVYGAYTSIENSHEGYWGEVYNGTEGDYHLIRIAFDINKVFEENGAEYDDWVWSCNFVDPEKFKSFQWRTLFVKKEDDGVKLIKELWEGSDSTVFYKRNILMLYVGNKMYAFSSLTGEEFGEIPKIHWDTVNGRYAFYYDDLKDKSGTTNTIIIDTEKAKIVCRGFVWDTHFNTNRISFPDGGEFTLQDIIDNYRRKNFFMSE